MKSGNFTATPCLQMSGDQLSQYLAPIFNSAINGSSVVDDTVRQFQNCSTVKLERWAVRVILANAFLCLVPDQHLAKESSLNFNRCVELLVDKKNIC
jgi:Poly (ADP-ribose) glycohydrolase (PARG)